MEADVKQLVKELGLESERLVLAISGGLDSRVLLHLFAQILPRENLIIAHLNHSVREESKEDQKFVAALAKTYQIEFETSVMAAGAKSEDVCRTARYSFLRKIRESFGARYIVTAHHLGDQAETVLLKLVRGSGPLDVWGMKQIDEDILRPLLRFSKEEILTYAEKHQLKWVEDKSNQDLRYARNFLRHKVIPDLKSLNPSFLSAIGRECELGQEAAAFVSLKVDEEMDLLKNGNKIDLKKLSAATPFVQKEIIKRALAEMVGREKEVSSENVEKVQELLTKKGSKKTELGRFTIEKNYDKIIFGSDLKTDLTKESDLRIAGEQLFNGFVISAAEGVATPAKNNILLPLQMAYNLKIRTWQPGDRIKTMSGTKKLQDIFSDAKVPLSERKGWPVVYNESEILWVPLLAASDRALKYKDKALVIEVKIEK